MTTVFVDADACPVKAEVEQVATRHKVQIYIVSNGGLRLSQNPLVQTIIVPDGPDVADMWIAERAGAGDVVITADIPLASKCIERGSIVLKHTGEVLNSGNIGNILATRDLMSDLRAADPFRHGGGKSFTKSDRSRFLDALENTLRKVRTGKFVSVRSWGRATLIQIPQVPSVQWLRCFSFRSMTCLSNF